MIIVGVDPGINGAISALEYQDGKRPTAIDAIDLPTIGSGKTREIDAVVLLRWIINMCADHAFLERAMAIPVFKTKGGEKREAGAASTFNFGAAYGEVRAILKLSSTPWTTVMPGVWKKYFTLRGGEKEAARQAAIRMIPSSAPLLTRRKDHQRAEAFLIGLYGARVKMPGAVPPAVVPLPIETFSGS